MPIGPFDDDTAMKALQFRLATFKDVWPFLEDCSCTPEKVRSPLSLSNSESIKTS